MDKKKLNAKDFINIGIFTVPYTEQEICSPPMKQQKQSDR